MTDKKVVKSDEIIDTSKCNKSGSMKLWLIFMLYLILVLIIVCFILFYSLLKMRNSNGFIDKNAQKYDNSGLKTEMNILTNDVQTLKDENSKNSNDINTMMAKIENFDLKIKKSEISIQRIELIKLALKIQTNIELDQNYSNVLNSLKTLMINNNDLESQIAILTKYQNNFVSKHIINADFNEEKMKFITKYNMLNDNTNDVRSFVSKFIIIRKVESAPESSPDDFINHLEQNMEDMNYVNAIATIENNQKYREYFSKTVDNIKVNIIINSAIQDIINYLTNN
jgi:hypothetical protein